MRKVIKRRKSRLKDEKKRRKLSGNKKRVRKRSTRSDCRLFRNGD